MSIEASTTTYVLTAFVVGAIGTMLALAVLTSNTQKSITWAEPTETIVASVGQYIESIPSNVLDATSETGNGVVRSLLNRLR